MQWAEAGQGKPWRGWQALALGSLQGQSQIDVLVVEMSRRRVSGRPLDLGLSCRVSWVPRGEESGAGSPRKAVGCARLGFWGDVHVERNQGGSATDRHSAGIRVDARPCSGTRDVPGNQPGSCPPGDGCGVACWVPGRWGMPVTWAAQRKE